MVVIQEMSPELREPKTFIMSDRHTCPFIQKVITLSFKVVCYTNVLEKTV